jgi:SSS family solute:Na+ symporter
MSLIDHLMVLSYLASVAVVTFYAGRAVEDIPTNDSPRLTAERHFLAGRQATAVEAVFSIAATEFSALTFVQLPAMAMLGKRGLLWGLIGILLGRWVVSRFLLRNLYRNGLTVFDALSRGMKDYAQVLPSAQRGQRLLAIMYFFTKLLAVSAGLSVGVGFIARFYGWPFWWVLLMVTTVTCAYTAYGGLKAVLRTDMLQFFAIGFAGLALLWAAVRAAGGVVIMDEIIQGSNIVAFGTSGLWPVLVGVVTGFVGDFSTHGVEQDYVQKLKACKSPKIAAKAVRYSAILTITLQVLFMVIGVGFITAFPLSEGHNIASMMGNFMDIVVSQLGPGVRGIVVMGLVAATMSSLDSSLNALSAVLWNDIFPTEGAKWTAFLIRVDNLVISFFAAIFAFFVGQNPIYLKGFFYMNTLVLLPLVSCFVLRFVSYPRVKFSFGFSTVLFVMFGCLIGTVFNSYYLDLPPQFALISCVMFSALLLTLYEKLRTWI